MSSLAVSTPTRQLPQPSLESSESSMEAADTTLNSSFSGSEFFDFASSDDEAGVFFGAHNPVERKIVASLSRSIPSSPASRNLSSIAEPRRSSLANRVKKRDSREFLRRKTSLHGSPDRSVVAEKVWEGGFFEKHVEEEEVAEEPEAGPSTLPPPENSTMMIDLEGLDIPPSELASFNADEEAYRNDSYTDDEETDKENALPETYYGSEDEDVYIPATEEGAQRALTLGFDSEQPDNPSTQLDMGGLSILDIDDPELGPLDNMEPTCDPFGESSEDSVDSESDSVASMSDVEEDPFLDTVFKSPLGRKSISTPVRMPDVPQPAASAGPSPFALSFHTPSKRTPDAANRSYDSELDSPIMARGPVVIPVFTIASPATATPLRGLAPGPSCELLDINGTGSEVAMSLPSLDSPAGSAVPTTTPRRIAPSMAPLPKTPATLRRTPPHVPLSVSQSSRPNRVLMSAKAAEKSEAEIEKERRRAERAEARAKERTLAIRGQLDMIAASKLSSTSRPALSPKMPMRASTIKATPQSTTKSRAPSSKPQVRLAADGQSVPTRLRDPSPVKALPKSILKAPSAPSGITKPVTGIPRPVARKLMAPPPSVQRLPISKVAAPEPLRPLSASLNAQPVEITTASSLKRPFSAIQPMSERAVVPVNSANRGPSRLNRDNARDTLGPQSSACVGGVATLERFGSTQPTKSPGKSSILGKPTRPAIFMTPTAHRTSENGVTRNTPSRPVGLTPLQQPPMKLVYNSAQKARGAPSCLTGSVRPINAPKLSVMKTTSEEPSDNATPVQEPAQEASPPQEKASADEQMEVDREGSDAKEEAPASEGANGSNEPCKPEKEAPPSRLPTVVAPQARRSGRTVKPPPRPAPTAAPLRGKATPAPSIVPGMTEKQLKTITQRNTMRNEVYLCAIDRQIVRIDAPRPPSPTSKIPKSADREDEEKKAEREARAKRRGRESEGAEEDEDEELCSPIITRVERDRAPGDDDDYHTPSRPAKRAKLSESNGNGDDNAESKFVHWNRALTVIRGGLSEALSQPKKEPTRSCLRPEAQIPLDQNGNVVDRPVEKLKRSKVTVTAVFYEGEEPVPIPSQSTRSKKK